ncbi:5-formyltetrahydrofolate cyclo-ligase [Plutella xylostella]|uniref:5-formyltetrahydrofolate cyclo-ligase n=1 Tax=Plutella xylostella TaxID=51655 RepID=UPI00203311C9|nr:5-formyltetrahydrofolate cyclo-ligase [Plutella xylostella]XP_037962381.2 5-formyltetrahydrofolate cyclo-ligase [Plutella xylostella]
MAPGVPNPAKMALRGEVSARIAALTADEKKRQSEIIFNKVIKHSWYKSSSRIALYMSTDQEVDTMPLIEHVKARGAAAFVPQYAGGHMKMLRVQSGDEDQMELTRHGIAQHAPTAVREDAFDHGGLDLIIAPGLAFTRSGKRLGHGGGYYDKYLAKVRAGSVATKVIALAFTCQVVEDLPVDDNDQRIDEVISADL